LQFGPFTLPVAGVSWLGTLPECRGRGLAHSLLA
jgi:predicted acetyltransferase